MTMPLRRRLVAGLISAPLLSLSRNALALDAPVRVVVAFPPGGPAEDLARAVTDPLSRALGRQIVLDHRPGANGNVAAEQVVKAASDGSTFLMSASSTTTINPHVYPKLAFNPAVDLVPVASTLRLLVFLVVDPKLPVKDAEEFLALLRNPARKLRYGSGGVGSVTHVAAEMLCARLGASAVHVPYISAAAPIQDLAAGKIDFMLDAGFSIQQVKAGRVKLLAVGSRRRSPLFPDIPTLEDVGLVGFDADTWFGFYAPAGTPKQLLDRFNAEVGKVVRNPALADAMKVIGAIPTAMSREDFAKRSEIDSIRFGAVIRTREIRAS